MKFPERLDAEDMDLFVKECRLAGLEAEQGDYLVMIGESDADIWVWAVEYRVFKGEWLKDREIG
jgi:hypothetical protein